MGQSRLSAKVDVCAFETGAGTDARWDSAAASMPGQTTDELPAIRKSVKRLLVFLFEVVVDFAHRILVRGSASCLIENDLGE